MKQILLATMLCSASLSGVCTAHATLQSSSPHRDAQLNTAPKMLSLTFDEAAQVAMLKLESGGKQIPISVDKSAKASTSFTFPLPSLAPGNYTVLWTAVSADDGHVTKGKFAFSITG